MTADTKVINAPAAYDAGITSYDTGIVKRTRATKVQLEERLTTLVEIAERVQPATVRHIYYQAVVAAIVEKRQTGYVKVQRALLQLRRSGRIPYHWIEDTSRRAHHPITDRSAESALRYAADTYRRDPWQDFTAPRVEVWCESRSIAGTLTPLVDEYAVSVFPVGGQASDSFAYEAASTYSALRPVIVLYAGDYDPAGLEIAAQLEGKLRLHAPGVDLAFRRLAITDDQAVTLQALGTPPKRDTWVDYDGDRHDFAGQAVELEAVDPVRLRSMFSDAIEDIAYDHHGYDIFAENRQIEADERDRLRDYADEWIGGGA